jgi:hypothetical protein
VRFTPSRSLRTCCGTGTGRWSWTSRIERITPQPSHASPGLSRTAGASPCLKSGMRMLWVNAGAASPDRAAAASSRAAPSRRSVIEEAIGYSGNPWMK